MSDHSPPGRKGVRVARFPTSSPTRPLGPGEPQPGAVLRPAPAPGLRVAVEALQGRFGTRGRSGCPRSRSPRRAASRCARAAPPMESPLGGARRTRREPVAHALARRPPITRSAPAGRRRPPIAVGWPATRCAPRSPRRVRHSAVPDQSGHRQQQLGGVVLRHVARPEVVGYYVHRVIGNVVSAGPLFPKRPLMNSPQRVLTSLRQPRFGPLRGGSSTPRRRPW